MDMLSILNTDQDEYDGYQALAAAIVMRGCLDYLCLKKHLAEAYNGRYAEHIRNRLEHLRKFFLSDWFITLSDLDGQWLIEQLDKLSEEMRRTGDYSRICQLQIKF